MQHFNMRPVGKQKASGAFTTKVRPGDTVSWRNPNTGGHHPNLEVLTVNKTTGSVLVRGVKDRLHAETFSVRLDQVTLTKRGVE